MCDHMGGRLDLVGTDIVVEDINDTGHVIVHVGRFVIGTAQELGGAVGQIRGDQFVEHTLFIELIEGPEAVCKKAEGAADKDTGTASGFRR